MVEDRQIPPYPITQTIPPEELDKEIRELERIKNSPLPVKFWGYLRLGGPGFMDSALTLGAGTLTAAMLSGATFGYKTMWLLWNLGIQLQIILLNSIAIIYVFNRLGWWIK